MRERGPYEYDKFVLNTLQLYNAVNLAEIHEMVLANNNMESLNTLSDTINSLYDNLMTTAENIFNQSHKYKEGF
jgi:hypothetical protein